MNAFALLLDGEMTATARLRQLLAGRRIIAADGGIRHAAALGVTPELWLGDFDSVPPGKPMPWEDVPRIAFPEEKDRTDGELAVDVARERGAADLLLAGAFGGPRADHALLHAVQAVQLAEEGLAVLLTDGLQEGRPLLPGEIRPGFPDGTRFSLIGITPLDGLTVTGARWPLEERHVPLGSSLTLSNVVQGELCIRLRGGKALLISSFPEAR